MTNLVFKNDEFCIKNDESSCLSTTSSSILAPSTTWRMPGTANWHIYCNSEFSSILQFLNFANCNICSIFWGIFPLKMQKWCGISPDKWCFSVDKSPITFATAGTTRSSRCASRKATVRTATSCHRCPTLPRPVWASLSRGTNREVSSARLRRLRRRRMATGSVASTSSSRCDFYRYSIGFVNIDQDLLISCWLLLIFHRFRLNFDQDLLISCWFSIGFRRTRPLSYMEARPLGGTGRWLASSARLHTVTRSVRRCVLTNKMMTAFGRFCFD